VSVEDSRVASARGREKGGQVDRDLTGGGCTIDGYVDEQADTQQMRLD